MQIALLHFESISCSIYRTKYCNSRHKETDKCGCCFSVIYISVFLFAIETENFIGIYILNFPTRIYCQNPLKNGDILPCTRTVVAAHIHSAGENINTVKFDFLVVLVRKTGFNGVFFIHLDWINLCCFNKI